MHPNSLKPAKSLKSNHCRKMSILVSNKTELGSHPKIIIFFNANIEINVSQFTPHLNNIRFKQNQMSEDKIVGHLYSNTSIQYCMQVH